MTEPAQRPGKSAQDVGTPRLFLDAVEVRFGKIGSDLAASSANAVCPAYFTEADDSLDWPWPTDRLCWLNPPFGSIRPWAEKCLTSASNVLMLVPASVGTNWWADYVHGVAHVLFLRPRITFVGHDAPFPKDLALCVYGVNVRTGYETWKWR